MIARHKPQAWIVIGMAALAFATTMIRFDNDFLMGLGFGIGLPMLAAGVYAIRRMR